MIVSCKMISSLVIMMLCLLVRTGYSLECYFCNVSTSQLDDDACTGISSYKKCQSNSVCLGASYDVNSGIVRTYTTMKTCFPNMAGEECKHFFKSQRDMLYGASVLTDHSCRTCDLDNCNKYISSSSGTLKILPILIFGAIGLNMLNLVKLFD